MRNSTENVKWSVIFLGLNWLVSLSQNNSVSYLIQSRYVLGNKIVYFVIDRLEDDDSSTLTGLHFCFAFTFQTYVSTLDFDTGLLSTPSYQVYESL